MELPGALKRAVGDESVATQVSLGGEDLLVVTPSRTVVYRAEGLLSDESVDEYGHGVERITVEETRRKGKVALDYGTDGERTLVLPRSRLDDALHPVLAGVLNAAGVTDSGETVIRTFRFSELTVVVTSARLVKHVGEAVWDGRYEAYQFDDVTDLRFEEGSHGTSVVLALGTEQERFKAPNDRARELRESLVEAILARQGLDSLDALRASHAESEGETGPTSPADGMTVEGLSPLGGDDSDDPGTTDPDVPDLDTADGTPASEVPRIDADASEESPSTTEPRGDRTEELAAEVAALREAVEAQGERIESQRELIERLIAELRRGR